MTKTYQEHILDLARERNLTEIPGVQELRQKAFARFETLRFPTRKLEAWKHTKLERILGQSFRSSSETNLKVDDESAFNRYHLAKDGEYRATYLNGVYSNQFSLKTELPKGVVLTGLMTALQNEADHLHPFLLKGAEQETNAFAAMNSFSFKKGVLLFVPPRVRIDVPIHVVFAGLGRTTEPRAFYPRLLVILGEDAQVNLVSSYISLNGDPYFMNGLSQAHLGKGAKLNWTSVQRLSDTACKVLTTKCYMQESSHLERVSFVRGGDVSHNETEIFFEGENATANTMGLAVLSRKSQVSELVNAHHMASHCTSRQTFKNILGDQSEAEFNSMVHVAHGTKGSDSHQLNRNLILSNAARAYSRPQLKIDSDEVAASHGSATGQLEDKELFYLRSRGFDLPLAKFVLTYGFAEEILEKIKADGMRWQLELHVRKEIEAMVQHGH